MPKVVSKRFHLKTKTFRRQVLAHLNTLLALAFNPFLKMGVLVPRALNVFVLSVLEMTNTTLVQYSAKLYSIMEGQMWWDRMFPGLK